MPTTITKQWLWCTGLERFAEDFQGFSIDLRISQEFFQMVFEDFQMISKDFQRVSKDVQGIPGLSGRVQ